jgi:hypothetical protein
MPEIDLWVARAPSYLGQDDGFLFRFDREFGVFTIPLSAKATQARLASDYFLRLVPTTIFPYVSSCRVTDFRDQRQNLLLSSWIRTRSLFLLGRDYVPCASWTAFTIGNRLTIDATAAGVARLLPVGRFGSSAVGAPTNRRGSNALARAACLCPSTGSCRIFRLRRRPCDQRTRSCPRPCRRLLHSGLRCPSGLGYSGSSARRTCFSKLAIVFRPRQTHKCSAFFREIGVHQVPRGAYPSRKGGNTKTRFRRGAKRLGARRHNLGDGGRRPEIRS